MPTILRPSCIQLRSVVFQDLTDGRSASRTTPDSRVHAHLCAPRPVPHRRPTHPASRVPHRRRARPFQTRRRLPRGRQLLDGHQICALTGRRPPAEGPGPPLPSSCPTRAPARHRRRRRALPTSCSARPADQPLTSSSLPPPRLDAHARRSNGAQTSQATRGAPPRSVDVQCKVVSLSRSLAIQR